MKVKLSIIGILLLTAFAYSQNMRWQTTHLNGAFNHSSGNCRLESSKIKITVHQFYVDVEEEAVIGTFGNIWSGADSLTLEITGTFSLSSYSSIRSMLLWNGDKILKARLKDRTAADSAYEEVVDRDKEVYVSRDPALIEYLGNNQYRFKIYPVAINKSRRIRILYTIPITCSGDKAQFKLQTVFHSGAYEHLESIPVEFVNSPSLLGSYKIKRNSGLKPIQFGSTYIFPFNEIAYTSIDIVADSLKWCHAYSYKIDSGNASGSYAAIIASMPDSLKKMITESAVYRYSCESVVILGEKKYVIQLPSTGVFSMLTKSTSPWDGTISWFVYDEDGNTIIKYDQIIGVDTTIPECQMIPLLWGAKYSLVEKTGNLGGLYGFVDNRMSLLALESDTLSASAAAQYAESGVPPLLPEEIIVDPLKIGLAPKESIIAEYTSIIVRQNRLEKYMLRLLSDHNLLVLFGEKANEVLKLELYDLSGKLVYSLKNISAKGKSVKVKIPNNFRGAFIVKLVSGSYSQQQKIILK